MSTLKRLQKLSSVSKALRKSASALGTAADIGLTVGMPVVGAGLLMEAPGHAVRTYKKSKQKFDPATHKAKLGLE